MRKALWDFKIGECHKGHWSDSAASQCTQALVSFIPGQQENSQD